MTWILTACFGMTFGLCNQVREFEYSSQDACYKARESVLSQVGKGWVICAPRKEQK
jgi:hypothetical protein